jgi:hypothetical protein
VAYLTTFGRVTSRRALTSGVACSRAPLALALAGARALAGAPFVACGARGRCAARDTAACCR